MYKVKRYVLYVLDMYKPFNNNDLQQIHIKNRNVKYVKYVLFNAKSVPTFQNKVFSPLRGERRDNNDQQARRDFYYNKQKMM